MITALNMTKKIKQTLLSLALLVGVSVFADDFKKEYADDPVCVIKTSQGDIYIELFAKEAPETVKNFIDLAEGKKTHTVDGKEIKIDKNYFDGLTFHRVIKDFMIQGGCPLGTGTGNPGYTFSDEISATSLGLEKKKVLIDGQPNQLLGIRSQEQFQQLIIMPIAKNLEIKSQEQFKERLPEIEKMLNEMTLDRLYELNGYIYNNELKSHHPNRGVLAMANSGAKTNGSQFFINLKDTPWLAGKHTVFGKVIKGMDIIDTISQAEVGKEARPKEEIVIKSIRLVE